VTDALVGMLGSDGAWAFRAGRSLAKPYRAIVMPAIRARSRRLLSEPRDGMDPPDRRRGRRDITLTVGMAQFLHGAAAGDEHAAEAARGDQDSDRVP
jgi:hypothetical protein